MGVTELLPNPQLGDVARDSYALLLVAAFGGSKPDQQTVRVPCCALGRVGDAESHPQVSANKQ
eukprot:4768476-Prorocentrum_lima.AAC.1